MKVNIIGAGLAGLSAAVTLAKRHTEARLISLMPSERAQSVLAEGGINAAMNLMGEDDGWEQHFEDTLRGGVYLADPNAVEALARHAPEVVRMLAGIGVPFQMEQGHMIQRNFGGQKKKRTAYARSSTGKALMNALIDETRRYEADGLITRYPHHEFLRLSMQESGRCAGVMVRDTWTEEILRLDGPVILSFGGMNGLFPGLTTGTLLNTGSALAEVFSQGAALANPEFIQYHPTTIRISGKRLLVSEAARGEGGRLFIERDAPGGRERWYFMEELYPELKNLMPRDVVSREMVRVTGLPECHGEVCLDLTGLSRKIWETRLPDLRKQLLDYLGIDPAKEPVPVSPGIHYFMGGLLVDAGHRTTIGQVYAAGECACQYHGANRLGGNSLLGAIYGGSVAAESLLRDAVSESAPGACEGPGGEDAPGAEEWKVSAAFSRELASILSEGLPILRSGERLRASMEKAEKLLGTAKTPMERKRGLLGLAILSAAYAREESRGAHNRSDYPEKNDERFRKTTVVRLENAHIRVDFAPIPEWKGTVS